MEFCVFNTLFVISVISWPGEAWEGFKDFISTAISETRNNHNLINNTCNMLSTCSWLWIRQFCKEMSRLNGYFHVSFIQFFYFSCVSTCVRNSFSHYQALGCVLYEMCALNPPFDASNLLSLFVKIIKAEFEVNNSMLYEHNQLLVWCWALGWNSNRGWLLFGRAYGQSPYGTLLVGFSGERNQRVDTW